MESGVKHFSRFATMVLTFCVLTSASLLLVTCLESAGLYIQQQVGFLVLAAVQPAFLVGCVISCVLALRATITRRHSGLAYAAVATQVVTVLLLTVFNLPKYIERWNFNSRLTQRMEVVELAKQGSLSVRKNGPCNCSYVNLPEQYANLSAGREVLVSRHTGGFSVTFFVSRRGMFPDDDYTGFVFRSDDMQPQTGVEDTDRFTAIQLIRAHWFSVRHT